MRIVISFVVVAFIYFFFFATGSSAGETSFFLSYCAQYIASLSAFRDLFLVILLFFFVVFC